MIGRRRQYLFISLLLLAVLALSQVVEAQEEKGWSGPFRLSTDRGKAIEASLVADKYGYAHIFWAEELPDERVIVRYARFDGETWSLPIDLRVTQPYKSITNVSAAIDKEGILYLAWSESPSGPILFTSVPAHNATSVQNWQKPRQIRVPADQTMLQVDSKGVLHILYVRNSEKEPGVHYIRSEDQGLSWSHPLWLDPDILIDHIPRDLSFIIDEFDNLHASWYYNPLMDVGGDWVRYIHSLDGGINWAPPVTIDSLEYGGADSEKQLSAAGPILAVQGRNVHIIWAGGKLHYRNHRYSTDSGQTWSDSNRIFGELNGQAGEGMAVDGMGRIHFFGQIRFPMAIYHAVWEDGQWSRPSIVYLIRLTSQDPVGDRIEAHRTRPVILAGNQLVLTFTDPPPDSGRRLFYMTRTLDDLGPIPISPSPSAYGSPVPSSTPYVQLTPALPPRSFAGGAPTKGGVSPGNALWFGIMPTLILIGSAFMIFRFLKTRY